MIDLRLLATIAITLTIPAFFVQVWPSNALKGGVLDTALGALAFGVIVGRITALTIDDPSSITSVSDVLIIRSGVEFWPGAFAALLWLAVGARRDRVPAAHRLAALAPAALVAWACFEATCLLRDGCPGPQSRIGLRPTGLSTPMFPIGLAVAAAALAGAYLVDRLHRRQLSTIQVTIVAVAIVAATRSVASFWLPHIDTGLTRQHKESIAVLAASLIALPLTNAHQRTPAAQTGGQ